MENCVMTNELSENNIDTSIELLLQHCKNKKKFRKDIHMISTGQTDSNNYSNRSIRRSRYSQTQFDKAVFNSSAAAGSNFDICTFYNCEIENANFQECTFINSSIINNPPKKSIKHSNFNESLFSDNFSIENAYFEHSVFYNTAFIGGKIKNTTFYSCTLEGANFSNVVMENVKFNDLNIDYAVFENVYMNKVILPFSQICYTFGVLSYLEKTDDEVYITSASNENGYIKKDEFLSLIPHFIKYYRETQDYFPLANIYFYLNEYENAKQYIKIGILTAVAEGDFRRIKYLSKLIYIYHVYDFHERQEIYDYIYSHISFANANESLLYNYKTFKNEIEGYILNNNNSGIVTAKIDIKTDILHNDAARMGILLSTIEEIIEIHKSTNGEHSILCRHNSEEELHILLEDILPALIYIIPTIYYVLMGMLKLEEKRLDIIRKRTDNKMLEKSNQISIELKKTQLKKEQMELARYENEELERQNYVRSQILRNEITNHNINIKNIKHVIIGDIPPYIDRQLVEYNCKKSQG